jgi:hypothetical protein
MKKNLKSLKESCACEGEESMTQMHKIRIDDFNRYVLQLSEEEQDTMSFKEIIADMMGTDPENIGRIKRSGAGWIVDVSDF